MSRSLTRRDPDTIEFHCPVCGARCSIHKVTRLELGHDYGCSKRPDGLSGRSETEEAA